MGNKPYKTGLKSEPCSTTAATVTASAPAPPSANTGCHSGSKPPAGKLIQAPMPLSEAKRWFVCRAPRPEAKYRMLCLAWAGGNSSIYRTWDLGSEVEVVAVELPGRNARVKETPLKNFHLLVSRLLHAMEVVGYLPSSAPSFLPSSTSPPPLKPLLLFGHSFGAMLVTHLAQALRERREDEGKSVDVPLVLVSGMAPLDKRGGSTGVSAMSDDAMIQYLVKMGGIPSEVAASRELMNVFLPAFRGDYTAIDNYVYTPLPALPFRLVAFAGENDARASKEIMEGWVKMTTHEKDFAVDVFPGGHFFIKEHTSMVLERIGQRVRLIK
ncbi:thioesterase [Nannochloropsis gaditana]|uniref:Thioesterase n=1 Tax=Nannochloropsis gaditana TaxID=72520 RepID=W7T220_9STRA|nr:thioesterase [Nannochloropsis gaditana]